MRIFMLLVSLNLAVAAVLTPDARTIWAKPSHVAGVITAVANTSFEILAGPRVKERVRVRFDRRTDFVDCEPDDLEPGRDADIVGVRLGNGDFLAARVVINESGCPVRTPIFITRGRTTETTLSLSRLRPAVPRAVFKEPA